MNKSTPSDLHSHIGYWLRCLSNLVSSTFAEKLAKRDISVAQWVVLRTLYDKRGVTMNEAAEDGTVTNEERGEIIEERGEDVEAAGQVSEDAGDVVEERTQN